ncbi:DNA-3-methyladenine glycosylase I [Microbacteriaceae bacterium MWH-Ta3]|nr:DNA-3-methyladenine glycosylase I [Microbacteriaceae bacterium MWH-Ta3]
MTISVVVGEDGRARCAWCANDQLYRDYHDAEWGRPITGDQEMFERITLEAFQSGLSWITILKRREGFRTAFAQFDAARVAAFTDADRDRLMNDAGIIRNRAKIDAAIHNAAIVHRMMTTEPGSLSDLIWSHAPAPRTEQPRTLANIPAITPESIALAKDLKARGFRFVGPTTAYAHMQAVGVVNDHVADCFVARAS